MKFIIISVKLTLLQWSIYCACNSICVVNHVQFSVQPGGDTCCSWGLFSVAGISLAFLCEPQGLSLERSNLSHMLSLPSVSSRRWGFNASSGVRECFISFLMHSMKATRSLPHRLTHSLTRWLYCRDSFRRFCNSLK